MLVSRRTGIIELCGPWCRRLSSRVALFAGLPLGVRDGRVRVSSRKKPRPTAYSPRRARRLAVKTSSQPSRDCRSTGPRSGRMATSTLEGDTEIFLELPDKFRRNESLTLGGGGGGTRIDRKEILNGAEFFDRGQRRRLWRPRPWSLWRRAPGGRWRRAPVPMAPRPGTLDPGDPGAFARVSTPQSAERGQQASHRAAVDERHPVPMDRHRTVARRYCRCTGSEDRRTAWPRVCSSTR